MAYTTISWKSCPVPSAARWLTTSTPIVSTTRRHLLADVTVSLLDASGNVISATQTDANGHTPLRDLPRACTPFARPNRAGTSTRQPGGTAGGQIVPPTRSPRSARLGDDGSELRFLRTGASEHFRLCLRRRQPEWRDGPRRDGNCRRHDRAARRRRTPDRANHRHRRQRLLPLRRPPARATMA